MAAIIFLFLPETRLYDKGREIIEVEAVRGFGAWQSLEWFNDEERLKQRGSAPGPPWRLRKMFGGGAGIATTRFAQTSGDAVNLFRPEFWRFVGCVIIIVTVNYPQVNDEM